MDYFPQFPAIAYPSLTATDRSSNFVVMTNILVRSSFLREITENSAIFYEYEIKDGETPEVIASKLYGDPKRFWIVLLFNKLNNPLYDFPLTNLELDSFIQNKYNVSVQTAQTTIHHYEEKTTKSVFFNDILQESNTTTVLVSALQQNTDTGVAEVRPYLPGIADSSLDGESYTESFSNGITVTVSTVYSAISTYTHELEENEKRRKIKLLDKNYVGNVETEFRRLMRDGA
jgi:hypothetical protein